MIAFKYNDLRESIIMLKEPLKFFIKFQKIILR